MRYVCKVHVLDVMDEVVVSGYVLDVDTASNPDHDTWEFAYQVPSYGRSDPADWLVSALYSVLTQMPKTTGPRK